MSMFVIVVGIACLTGFLVMHFAMTHQEHKAWQEFVNEDLSASMDAGPIELSGVPPTVVAESVEVPKALRWREMLVVRLIDESPDCRSFYFADPDEQAALPAFFGGQYLIVSLPDPDSPGRQISRCYSLSDGVSESVYRITVKRVPGGKMSNLLHETVRVGDKVRVQLPAGRFHIGHQTAIDESGKVRPLNLIAAGIGITPMISMLRECTRNTPQRPVRLFYQLRDASNAPFLSELRQLAEVPSNRFQLYVAFSKPNRGDLLRGDMKGRMDASGILNAVGSNAGNFMICGPEDFMRGIASGLYAKGVPQECVEFESFAGPAKPKSKQPTESNSPIDARRSSGGTAVATEVAIRFNQSRRDAVWTDQDGSLLETAERCGVAIDSACRSGQCGSCIVRLLSGNVRYEDAPEFDGLGENEVLACIAQPNGPIELDA